ncbi:hypothetical protein [Caulobacter sp. Root1472]|uniref:hypothetical protein n=1 Tax=Caulobacter sp. Root1472 TaxID=1736470 RepID=UPI0006F5A621|nr:hypothetical protein [Caulobacter sp. Root1472]KQZ26430.1 hypothetical protein ASD47_23115 [Caulobacter sp. Root1472]
MTTHEDSDPTDPLDDLTNDILWILIGVFVMRSRSQFEGVGGWSSQRLGEELFMLEALQRDLVVRLLALDDDDKGQRSFRSVMKTLKARGILKGTDQEIVDAAVKAYRALVNTMKVKHRNAYIGHMKEGQSATPKLPQSPEGFGDAIAKSVEIVDQIARTRQAYSFKLTGGQLIDLRAELGV